MIHKVEMYACKCDNCGKEWEDEHYGWVAMTDEFSIKQMLSEEDEWYVEGDKHYCGDCFGGFDDDDNIIIIDNKETS